MNKNTYQMVLTALFAAIIILMAFTPLGYIPLVVINATIIHIPVILGSLFCGPKKGAFLGFLFGLTSFIKNTIMPTSLSAFVFSPVLAADMVGVSGIFKSILICFLPRILVGVVPYFVYLLIKKAVGSENKKLWSLFLNLLVGIFTFIGVRAFALRMGADTITPLFAIGAGLIAAVIVFAVIQWFTVSKNGDVVAFVYTGVSGAMVNTLLVMGGIFVLYKDAYASACSIDPNAVLGVIGGVISFNGVVEAIVAAVIISAIAMVLKQIEPIAEPSRKGMRATKGTNA